jgi:hypothetical protein
MGKGGPPLAPSEVPRTSFGEVWLPRRTPLGSSVNRGNRSTAVLVLALGYVRNGYI